jgi:homoserine kinase
MNYLDDHYPKGIGSIAMQRKLASGNAHADNVALPLGGFTLVKFKSVDIIRIESPSELYATVVHPQIELLRMHDRY